MLTWAPLYSVEPFTWYAQSSLCAGRHCTQAPRELAPSIVVVRFGSQCSRSGLRPQLDSGPFGDGLRGQPHCASVVQPGTQACVPGLQICALCGSLTPLTG